MESKQQNRLILYFLLATALRLAVFYLAPTFADALTDRVEISTPISSFKRLLEGLFLHESGLSPYDGGVYHQAPLLLTILQILPHPIVFTGLDLLNAWNISLVASRLALPSPRFVKLDSTILVAIYLFNPFTIMACLGRSSQTFTNTAILQATSSAISGNMFGTLFALAFGTYLTIYPGLILPPLLLLLLQSRKQPVNFSTIFRPTIIYLGLTALLLALSIILIGPANAIDMLRHCYLAQVSLPDLTPNIGLWWYFFIEIFDAFRPFFIGVFWTHLISYVGALTVRLPDQPLFVIITLCGLFAVFKPYPSIADISLYFGMLPLYQHVFPRKFYSPSLSHTDNHYSSKSFSISRMINHYPSQQPPSYNHLLFHKHNLTRKIQHHHTPEFSTPPTHLLISPSTN